LFGLISGIAISYGIKRHKYKNKKNIFILIVFCSFLIYFVFSMIFMYILFRTGDRCYDMLTYKDQHIYSLQHKNYNVSLKEFLLYTLGHWPLFWYDMGCNCVISVIIDQLSFFITYGSLRLDGKARSVSLDCNDKYLSLVYQVSHNYFLHLDIYYCHLSLALSYGSVRYGK
jgi:hypothetical protein